MITKRCPSCGETLPAERFGLRSRNGGHYLRSWCKPCTSERTKRYMARREEREPGWNVAYQRRTQLKVKFGLSLEDYAGMLESQRGACAICLNPETHTRGARERALVVDHDRSCCSGDRSCGRCVRGLLCNRCNTALGMIRDDIAAIERAADYLRIHSALETH